MKKLLLVSAAIAALAPAASFASIPSNDALSASCAVGTTACVDALVQAFAGATTQTEVRTIVDFALAAGLTAEDLGIVLATALSLVGENTAVAKFISAKATELGLTLPPVASTATPITAS